MVHAVPNCDDFMETLDLNAKDLHRERVQLGDLRIKGLQKVYIKGAFKRTRAEMENVITVGKALKTFNYIIRTGKKKKNRIFLLA